jgi:hypothetical protein
MYIWQLVPACGRTEHQRQERAIAETARKSRARGYLISSPLLGREALQKRLTLLLRHAASSGQRDQPIEQQTIW